jgi:predicted branched-subunit amino acid permease
MPDGRPATRVAAGLIDTVPFVPSTVALGAVFGASAGPAGIQPPVAVAMSAIVWSGAGQFAALPLWAAGASPLVLGLATLVLSLRFALVTASLAPELARLPLPVRALLAFGVTDENYALAVSRRGGQLEPGYLFGSALVLYVTWVGGTIVGVLLGASLPAAWAGPLAAVFPVVFLVLTVLVCASLPAAAVAGVGALLGVLGALYLPAGWHVLAAGLLASLAGLLLERLLGRPVDGEAAPP